MNAWKRCRKCYWLKYEMKVPQIVEPKHFFAYGRYIHESVEAKESGQPVKDIIEMLKATSDSSLYHVAEKHLNFYGTLKKKLRLNHGVSEVEFLIETGEDDPLHGGKLWLYGILDYVEYSKDTEHMPKSIIVSDGKIKGFLEDGNEVDSFKVAKIIEYKTRKGRYSLKEIDTEYQFSMYYIVSRMLPRSTAFRMQLVNFVKNQTGDVQVAKIERNATDIRNFWDETRRALDDMAKKLIPPMSTCGYYSPYGEVCQQFDPMTLAT